MLEAIIFLLLGSSEMAGERTRAILNSIKPSAKEYAPAPVMQSIIPKVGQRTRNIINSSLSIKNNNLGNIKNFLENEWVGQVNYNTDDLFAIFETPELGIRALGMVINANIKATNSFETYVNRYASEPEEQKYFKETGKLLPHLQDYAKEIAFSQGIANTKSAFPKDINMLSWIRATAKAEGGQAALNYFTDDIILRGLSLGKDV
tara:strand:+ start:582 stop:1196 length:615 start_codon:yes stop_codon:yes gene_type:complete